MLAAVGLFHVTALCELLRVSHARPDIAEPAPLYVSFIPAPPQVRSEVPSPPPPRVSPRPHRPHARLLSTPAAARAVASSPLPPPPDPPPSPVESSQANAPPQPQSTPAPLAPPDFAASYLDNPAPAYPPLSRRLHESGTVLLRVHVNVDGHGDHFDISQSSGYERLDQAALDAVRRWRFVSAHQGPQAMAAWVPIPINFQLDR